METVLEEHDLKGQEGIVKNYIGIHLDTLLGSDGGSLKEAETNLKAKISDIVVNSFKWTLDERSIELVRQMVYRIWDELAGVRPHNTRAKKLPNNPAVVSLPRLSPGPLPEPNSIAKRGRRKGDTAPAPTVGVQPKREAKAKEKETPANPAASRKRGRPRRERDEGKEDGAAKKAKGVKAPVKKAKEVKAEEKVEKKIRFGGVRPDLAEASKRLDTFIQWAALGCITTPTVNPSALADAGFYHDPKEGQPDKATCFWCHMALHFWDPKDNPAREHRKHSKHCAFIRTHGSTKVSPRGPKGKANDCKEEANDCKAEGESCERDEAAQ